MRKIATGVTGLDEVLRGGIAPGHVYLVEGAPGTGKTTVGMQFLLEGIRQGEAGLFATLSESEAELKAVARSHGWNLAGIQIHDLTPAEEALESGEQYTLFHPSEVEFGESIRRLLDAVEADRPGRIVIDSLTELRLLARDPLHYRRQILMLRRFFSKRECTVLLLDDQVDVPDLQLHSLAHGVVRLEHWSPDYGPGRRRLIVRKVRGQRFLGGYHDLRIVRGGVEVYPRLAAAVAMAPTPRERERISSGSPELDALVGGGMESGMSVLVTGPAGAGKSTLAAQWLLHGAKQGRLGAIYTFDEIAGTYVDRCDGLGLPLRSLLDEGKIRLSQVDPAEMSPGHFASRIRAAVKKEGVRSLVIDSLNGYLWSMSAEQNLVLHLHELLTWLQREDVFTAMVLSEHGLVGRVNDSPVDLSYLSDTVIQLRYFEYEGLVRKAVSVVKKRIGGHESSVRELRVAASGVRIGEPLREFQGVLAGTPTYQGPKAGLLQREGAGE